MPHPGHQLARGHLRLAAPPPTRRRGDGRLLLLARALFAAAHVALRSVAAWWGAALALCPLLWRRAPLGRRARPVAPRVARVIPFHRAQRRAVPR